MNRVKIAKLILIIIFLFLCLGLLNLEIVHYRQYRSLSEKNCIRLLPQAGARGKIFDRNGKIIVDNRLSYDVMILPQESRQEDKALAIVSSILETDINDLRESFANEYSSSSIPVTIARNISIKKAIALEESRLDTPGIIIQQVPLRNYPYANLASHVTGYVGEIDRWRLTKLEDYGYKTKDLVGFGGVEEKYDYYLRQEEGGLSVEVDHRGRFVRVLGFRPGRNGKDLHLTLDLEIQKIVEDNLSGQKGCVIIMDPYSGEIISMASFPNFNPVIFVNKQNSSISSLVNDPDAPFINRAISGVFPPGSIFKPIVAAAALETGKIKPSTTFFCKGSINVGNKEFSCWEAHNGQNLVSALARSCNVFFYKTGLLLKAQLIHDYALKFGLSKSTSFELPYEADGFIPSPLWSRINRFRSWFDGDTVNLSIGQGDCLVTPLQMARMMAVFANKGYLITPYIVHSIEDRDISVYHKRNFRVSIKESTIDYISQGLREAVSDPQGTAHVLYDLPVSVAGKTGTAQVIPGQPHAWFIGFFPYKKPKYVICVFLERSGPSYLSCLLAKKIIEEMVNEGLI